MNLSFKTTLSSAALLLTSLLTPALAQTAPSDTQAQIEQSGTLRVGMSTFAPWAMRDKQGALIGFEIDVARRLATDNGWQVEFVPTAWDGIIPSLLAKKYDVIIGGLTITPEREKSVRFTQATMSCCRNWSTEMFTATRTGGIPLSIQHRACSQAACNTQSPIETIKPESSAIGMKSAGDTVPNSG